MRTPEAPRRIGHPREEAGPTLVQALEARSEEATREATRERRRRPRLPVPMVEQPDVPDPRGSEADDPGDGDTAVPSGAFAALRHRNFRWFYVGQLVSLTGTWMQSTAQGWLVLQLTNSPLRLGLVTAVGSLPVLIFSLYAGVLADRADKRRIILTANCVAALLATLLAWLVWSDQVTYGWVLAIAFAIGTASAFEVPTRQAFFVQMVGKRELPNAIALNSVAFNATRIVGPAVAGFLIAASGLAVCFWLNAVSYAAVIGSLLALRLPHFRPSPSMVSAWQGISEGLGFLRRERRASALIGIIAGFSVLAFPYAMLLPVFARDVLAAGPRGLGWLSAATGTGALAGGLLTASYGGRFPRGRTLVVASLVCCACLAGFAISSSLPLSLALLAGAGFSMIVNNATLNAALQGLVPDDLRGRVMAVYVFMFLGMVPLGALQAGALARWVGAPLALATGALVLFGILATVWIRMPELRRIR